MASRTLGPYDEPQDSGAIVVVHWGSYRNQEIWVRSGANIGNWYCLGNEFRKPRVWDDNVPQSMWDRAGKAPPERPPGSIPQHPHWEDILARGPVTLLTPGDNATYAAGWRNGRQALWESMEDEIWDGPPTDHLEDE